MNTINILGTRGVPAKHGGFETFAESLALYLADNGWDVTVYCQVDYVASGIYEDKWKNIRRINIPISNEGAFGTILFDIKATWHSLGLDGVMLVLGYNTAFLSCLYRLFGKKSVMNMDGIEWKRGKWSFVAKTWFYLNEKFGSWFSNHQIADHPEIKAHLLRNSAEKHITVIPYAADYIQTADISYIEAMELEESKYFIVIARPEPENSILEIVTAFSKLDNGMKLVVLGKFSEENLYHQNIKSVANENVIFPGAIYDKPHVNSLRFYCRAYVHGHTVGGTNPSLVEALGAGNAIIAHDNKFNRWVAGEAASYFDSIERCYEIFDEFSQDEGIINVLRVNSNVRYKESFTHDLILSKYEKVLESWLR